MCSLPPHILYGMPTSHNVNTQHKHIGTSYIILRILFNIIIIIYMCVYNTVYIYKFIKICMYRDDVTFVYKQYNYDCLLAYASISRSQY